LVGIEVSDLPSDRFISFTFYNVYYVKLSIYVKYKLR